jgi:hypothetical protein
LGKAIVFVVLLISAVLVVVFLKTMITDKNGPAPTAPIERAKAIECLNSLRNARGALSIYYGEKNEWPMRLADVDGVVTSCPVTGQPYVYDNTTGRISCSAHPRY